MTRTLNERIAAVRQSRAKGLAALAEVAGLDPRKAFRFANLRMADLRGQQLAHFDFTGADFRGAKLKGAIIDPSQLRAAKLDPRAEQRVARTFHLNRIERQIENGDLGLDLEEIVDKVSRELQSLELTQADVTQLAVQILGNGYRNESCIRAYRYIAAAGWRTRARQCLLAGIDYLDSAEWFGKLLRTLRADWHYAPSAEDLTAAICRISLNSGINLIRAAEAHDPNNIDFRHFLMLGSDVHSTEDWEKLLPVIRELESSLLAVNTRKVRSFPLMDAAAAAFAGVRDFDVASEIVEHKEYGIWTSEPSVYELLFQKARNHRSVIRELAILHSHKGERVPWFWEAVKSLPPGQAAALVGHARDFVPLDSNALASAYHAMPGGKHRFTFCRGLRKEAVDSILILPRPRASIRTILSLLDIAIGLEGAGGGVDSTWEKFLTLKKIDEYGRYLERSYQQKDTMRRELPYVYQCVLTTEQAGSVKYHLDRERLRLVKPLRFF